MEQTFLVRNFQNFFMLFQSPLVIYKNANQKFWLNGKHPIVDVSVSIHYDRKCVIDVIEMHAVDLYITATLGTSGTARPLTGSLKILSGHGLI